MGKKKFIDKKRATTYSLVFRTEEADDDDEGGERVLVPMDELPGGVGACVGPPSDPAALYR